MCRNLNQTFAHLIFWIDLNYERQICHAYKKQTQKTLFLKQQSLIKSETHRFITIRKPLGIRSLYYPITTSTYKQRI